MYGLLVLEINLAATLLVLFIRIKTLGISQMVSQRNFSSAIDAEIVFFLSDTAAALMLCGTLPFSREGLIAAKTVYFFSTAVMCFCWLIYFEHLFKAINDTYGHLQGDLALEKIADALRLSCTDLQHRALIARYGGDEFAILAPADGPREMELLRDSIQKNLAEMSKGLRYELSVSVGIVKAEKGKDMKTLIGEADTKLYKAKKARPKE